MSQDFTTRLQLELRAAAQRQERRGALGRLRLQAPRPALVAAAAVAAALLIALVLAGGLDWRNEQTITAPRVAHTFPVADNLGTISAAYGAVWATDPAADQLLRVDPRTRRVTARIPAMPNPIVNTGADAVWVVGFADSPTAASDLVRIDPETARVTARTRLRTPEGEPFAASDVQVLDGAPWVVGPSGALRLDPSGRRVTGFVPIPERAGDPFPLGAAVTPGGLVVLRRDRRLERYDLDTGRLNKLVPVRLSDTRMFGLIPAGPIFVDGAGDLALADPDSGRIVWTQRPGNGASGPPYPDGDRLWTHVTGPDGDSLVALSPKTGEIVSETRLPEFGVAGATMVGRELWLSAPNGKLMVVQVP